MAAPPGETAQYSADFYDGVLGRITRSILLLGATLLIPILIVSVPAGAGWAFGVAVSFANFRSLTTAVEALGDRIVNRQSRESGGRIVAKFLLRYVLFALAAYAIFKMSAGALYGVLAGLLVPIAAIMCEAFYEAYVAIRRGV
ncbi:MAG TPA: ATP synthase subunit I [Terriglobales bacterium]|nr:ATP synthase subunit I [Terriglobales bacterium]